jgi:integrase/recombinase XerD
VRVIHPTTSKRSDRSINAALAAVTVFYKFHEQLGELKELSLYQSQLAIHQKYKPFLHHLGTTEDRQSRLLKVKVLQKLPVIVTSDEIKRVLDACYYLRDKFLVSLLYETGMRIGQALGLYHQDIKSFDNEVHIIPREDHVNHVRTKSYQVSCLHINQVLMQCYVQYVTTELTESANQHYVFIALKGPHKGQPLRYTAIQNLFKRFSRVPERKITPHMLRHTHATELIHAGWNMSLIQKRLGHKSIQTTVNTYIHINNEEMKAAFKRYEEYQDDRKP